MREVIEHARKRSGLTQNDVAKKLFLSVRQYQRLIDGELPMSPEIAVKLGEVIDCPQLTILYCRKLCAVGDKYCYEVLNNVDLNPSAILSKYRQEEGEAHEALEQMAILFLNKKDGADCTDEELKGLARWSLEMLDLEHVIETLKLRLWDFLNVGELVETHNRKCFEKKYVDKDKPELLLAG